MNTILAMFLIMAIGYMLGHIRVLGVKFGASAILITALVFGHFGVEPPPLLSSLGLVLFLAPIGLMAGRTFVNNVKKNGVSFLLIAIITCIVGGVTIVFAHKVFNIPIELALGLGTGALTSTAMLGTVTSLTDSPLPGVGYGIAYVFGVLGVVLLVQLVPRIVNANREVENEKLTVPESKGIATQEQSGHLINFEPHGLFGVAVAIALGVLIGSIKIPFGDTVVVSLGSGGGAISRRAVGGDARRTRLYLLCGHAARRDDLPRLHAPDHLDPLRTEIDGIQLSQAQQRKPPATEKGDSFALL